MEQVLRAHGTKGGNYLRFARRLQAHNGHAQELYWKVACKEAMENGHKCGQKRKNPWEAFNGKRG